jgi:hypothetical protein
MELTADVAYRTRTVLAQSPGIGKHGALGSQPGEIPALDFPWYTGGHQKKLRGGWKVTGRSSAGAVRATV